jgi:hypothetical protein
VSAIFDPTQLSKPSIKPNVNAFCITLRSIQIPSSPRVESWVWTWVSNPGFAPNSCAQKMKSEIESCRVCFCFLCQRFSTQPSFPNPASNPGNVFCLSHHISIQTMQESRAGFGPGFQILGLHQNSCAQKFKNEIEICRACFCFLCQRFSTQPSFPNPASNPAGNSWEETLKHKVCLAIDWHNYVWNCKSTDDVFE